MSQQYGLVKVDFLTYTSGQTGAEQDVTVTVSGLATTITEGPITVTGNIITTGGDIRANVGSISAPSGNMTAESGIFTVGLSAPVGSIPTLTGTTATYTTGIFNTLTATGLSVDTITATGDITSTQNITATLTVSGQTIAGVNINGGNVSATSGFRSASGTSASPAFSFTDDTDTGIYTPSGNEIAIATSGQEQLKINASGAVAFNTQYGTSGHVLQTNGSAAPPTWVPQITLNSGEIIFRDGANDFTGPQAFISGTAAVPGITFVDDRDTGIFSPSVNAIGLTVSGVEAVRVFDDGTVKIAGSGTPATDPQFQFLNTGNAKFTNGILELESTLTAGTLLQTVSLNGSVVGGVENDGGIKVGSTSGDAPIYLKPNGAISLAGDTGTAGFVLTSQGDGQATWTQASGGGGANVTISENPPASPADGDLWWSDEEGAGGGLLFIYYNDGNSAQWVEASPSDIPSTEGFIKADGSVDMAAPLALVLGSTPAAPALTFSGDTDTGFYHTGSSNDNTIFVSTSGVERARFSEGGDLYIGTTSTPAIRLNANGTVQSFNHFQAESTSTTQNSYITNLNNVMTHTVLGDGTTLIGDDVTASGTTSITLKNDGDAIFGGLVTASGGVKVTGGTVADVETGLFLTVLIVLYT